MELIKTVGGDDVHIMTAVVVSDKKAQAGSISFAPINEKNAEFLLGYIGYVSIAILNGPIVMVPLSRDDLLQFTGTIFSYLQ